MIGEIYNGLVTSRYRRRDAVKMNSIWAADVGHLLFDELGRLNVEDQFGSKEFIEEKNSICNCSTRGAPFGNKFSTEPTSKGWGFSTLSNFNGRKKKYNNLQTNDAIEKSMHAPLCFIQKLCNIFY